MAPKAHFQCPLCGAPNECVPAHTGNFDTPCWCATVTIDPAALEPLPEPQRNQSCLCIRCATGAALRVG